MSETEKVKFRAHYLGQNDFYNLNAACKTVLSAFHFSWGVFLVGSCLRTKDFRDVDVRAIVPDAEFDRLFPDYKPDRCGTFWNFICTTISEWLRARTGLPVDFQVQRATDANKEFPNKEHRRNGMGHDL
jgi:hypothetical protein